MGGNALNCTSVRLAKEDYDRVAKDCVAKLQALYPSKKIKAIGSYHAKADFGDCDILLEGGDHYDPHTAAAALDAVEVVRNGPVTSVGVRVDSRRDTLQGNLFQVDLIKIESEAFEFALNYFGAADTGNLVGRIAHSMGLSHRHDGLYFYLRDGDYKFREILLTQNYSEALAFMGYDPAKYKQGFDNLEDIFRYVASTKYFNRDIFLLQNRNAKARVRDKKRKVYMEFLKWCEEHLELPAFVYPNDKSAWLPVLSEAFPQFEAEHVKALSDLATLRAVKAKFNGEWVSKITGLQGKELGEIMRRFKESFDGTEALYRFILENDQASLEARVKQMLDLAQN